MMRAFSLFAKLLGTAAAADSTAPTGAAPGAAPGTRQIATILDTRRIVPIIKPRAWLAQSQLAAAHATPFDFVTDDLNTELVVVYVEDDKRNLRYLSAAQLAEFGLTQQELRPLALENLMRLLPQIQLHSTGPVSMLTAGGNYEASLLLVKEFWSAGKVQVAGEIVVAVPSRDVVLITGSANPEGLAQLQKLARASRPAKASFELTQTLFVCRDGQFLPWSA